MTEDVIYETTGSLQFWDCEETDDDDRGVLIPAKTCVHLGAWTNRRGNISYEPGKVAHICAGPHKGWVRIYYRKEMRTIPFLELLARAAE